MSDQSDAMLTLAKACVWACMTGNKTISHPAPRARIVLHGGSARVTHLTSIVW